MQKMEKENIDHLVCRLRQKAISCEFPKVDEAIRVQIIDKWRDPKHVTLWIVLRLKLKGVKCKSRNCEKKLFAYGQTKPTEVVGSFEGEIHCEDSAMRAIVYFLFSNISPEMVTAARACKCDYSS